MSGGKEKEGGERFADLVDGVAPLDDRDRVRPHDAPRPRARARPGGAAAPTPAFLRDTGEGSGRARDTARRLVSELRTGEYPPEREIDLHGLRRDAARRALDQGLASALAARECCVLVIHGVGRRSPGEPVLKASLAGWLEESPHAGSILAFCPAPRALGGEGATLVRLRRSS